MKLIRQSTAQPIPMPTSSFKGTCNRLQGTCRTAYQVLRSRQNRAKGNFKDLALKCPAILYRILQSRSFLGACNDSTRAMHTCTAKSQTQNKVATCDKRTMLQLSSVHLIPPIATLNTRHQISIMKSAARCETQIHNLTFQLYHTTPSSVGC